MPAAPLTIASPRIPGDSLPGGTSAAPRCSTRSRPVPCRAMDDWRSYDDVAETYERVHAPRFAEVARDLVALAGDRAPATSVLDVGTGTGVAAQAAADAGATRRWASTNRSGCSRSATASGPTLRLAAADAIDLPVPHRPLRRRRWATSCSRTSRSTRPRCST